MKKSRQKMMTRRVVLGLLGAGLLLASCGKQAGTSGDSCNLSGVLSPTLQEIAGQAVFTATLDATCASLVKESGELKVTLVVTLPAGKDSEKIWVQKLTAGTRSREWKTSADLNLKSGSISHSFLSSAQTGWALPWSDAPTQIALTVRNDAGSTDYAAGTKVDFALTKL